MMVNLCPTCRRIHASDAQRCASCGADLSEGDTWPSPQSAAQHLARGGALWLDDLAVPRARLTESPPEPGEMHLDLTLREIAVPPPPGRAAVTPVSARPMAAAPLPAPLPAPAPVPAMSTASDRPVATPAAVSVETLMLPPLPVPPSRPTSRAPPAVAASPWRRSSLTPLSTDAAARSAQKVARRGEVRRARLRAAQVAQPGAGEVLVLDPDAGTRAQLCALLQSFGFIVTETGKVAHAALLTQAQPFVAAFIDVPLDAADGGAGIDLCRRIRQDDAQRGSSTLMVLVAASLTPVDRVRADLAGFDDAIVKPVSRGAVAVVFDSRGLALPADARRV